MAMVSDMPQSVLAVVSVLGKDQKGVVAQFATYMAERGINIQDIEQRVVRGIFVMDMLVDLKEITIDLSELITGLIFPAHWDPKLRIPRGQVVAAASIVSPKY